MLLLDKQLTALSIFPANLIFCMDEASLKPILGNSTTVVACSTDKKNQLGNSLRVTVCESMERTGSKHTTGKDNQHKIEIMADQ